MRYLKEKRLMFVDILVGEMEDFSDVRKTSGYKRRMKRTGTLSKIKKTPNLFKDKNRGNFYKKERNMCINKSSIRINEFYLVLLIKIVDFFDDIL